jgi:hypothetical protein
MEAEIGEVHLQNNKCHDLEANTRSWKRPGWILPRSFRERKEPLVA